LRCLRSPNERIGVLSFSWCVGTAYLRADPGRIAAGAITGVGFIGAGVVLRTGFSIQGLTTAATIWMVSAIGLAVGEGLYLAVLLQPE